MSLAHDMAHLIEPPPGTFGRPATQVPFWGGFMVQVKLQLIGSDGPGLVVSGLVLGNNVFHSAHTLRGGVGHILSYPPKYFKLFFEAIWTVPKWKLGRL
jgi:hypothetical protein